MGNTTKGEFAFRRGSFKLDFAWVSSQYFSINRGINQLGNAWRQKVGL